jgi:hypothetical protein
MEPVGVELSVPAAQAAAAAPSAEAATTVRLVSEALSVAAGKPAAGVLTGGPAAVEPAAATAAVSAAESTAAVSAAESTAAKGERPVLANGPAAASKERWVLNPGVGSKVIMRKLSMESAAAAARTAAAESLCQGRNCPRWPGGRRRRPSLRLW